MPCKTLCLMAVLVIGCSKPQCTPEIPTAEIASVEAPETEASAPLAAEIKPTATPTATTSERASAPNAIAALPRTKARILAGLQGRKFVLEPAESSAMGPGVTTYQVKGAPFSVAFTEEAGSLREVEAMSPAGMSDQYIDQMQEFATTIGEITTGELRYTMNIIVEDVMRDVGRYPGSTSRTLDGVRTTFTLHKDGGHSFTFTAMPKPVPKPKSKPKADPELSKSKAEIMALLTDRGYKLELVETPTPKPGETRYRAKGDPVGIAFTEVGGKLRSVEALTIDDDSANLSDMAAGLATTLCVELTGNTRDLCREELERMMDELRLRPAERSLWMGNGKKEGVIDIVVTKHEDRSYSFKFSIVIRSED